MKRRMVPVLWLLCLSLLLCACGQAAEPAAGQDQPKSITGGKTAGGGAKTTETEQGAQALLDYAKRLEEAGNPEAAAAVYARIPAAAQRSAQEKAEGITDSGDYQLMNALAELDLSGALRSASEAETPPEPSQAPAPEATPKPAEPFPGAEGFTDVKEGDWFYDAAMWAARTGLVSGDTFRPGETCTRAQAVTFLYRAAGQPLSVLSVSPYTDVKPEDYCYRPVLWAFENGLLSAASDGRFRGDEPVTRAQAASFLYRASGEEKLNVPSPFSDVGENDWFRDAAVWVWAKRIVSLGENGTFDPSGECNRAQYMTFLYRRYGEN